MGLSSRTMKRASVWIAAPSYVVSRAPQRLLAACAPIATSMPSLSNAANPKATPMRMYCGIITQKPYWATSGLAACMSPNNTDGTTSAHHRLPVHEATP